MTMKLGELKNFKNARQKYADTVTSGADADTQAQAYSDMMDALQGDLQTSINDKMAKMDEKLDLFEANRRVDPKITNREVEFFNELKTDTTNKSEKILPEETINQIFDDLTTEHPLLAEIGLKTTGLRLKILRAESTGAAVWGKIYDEIKGQLDEVFTEDDATQSKLTAFVVVPNDALEYGAAWLKQFVLTQIKEAFAVALEQAFLTGDGNNKPIGLNRDVSKGVAVTDHVYPEKKSAGKITLADTDTVKKEIGGIVKKLSVKENGQPLNTSGMVDIVVRPSDHIDFETAAFMQNVNGQWVFALPFGVNVVESVFVPENKAIAFVKGRYDAYTAGAINIKQFDQTLALEDMQLFTAKQFVYGKAKDGNAAQVYDLAVDTSVATGGTTSDSTPKK